MSNWDPHKYQPSDLQTLIDTELPPQACWIEPAILPKRGKLLLGGEAKSLKSFFMLNLGRALIRGDFMWGTSKLKAVQPTTLLLIEQELGPWELQKRTRQMFAGEDADVVRAHFRYLSQARGLLLDEPDSVKVLTEWCLATGANVLMLDPVGKMYRGDENDSRAVGTLFDRLERVMDNCIAQDLSLVLTHHFVKPSRDPRDTSNPYSPYNFRGSSKWFDEPDMLITLLRDDPARGRVTTGWFPRCAAPQYRSGQAFNVDLDGKMRVQIENEGASEDDPPRSPRKIVVSKSEEGSKF